MLEEPAAQAMRHAISVCLQLGGPPLFAMLAVGVVISLIQTLTQIQESTVAFLPKIAVMGGILLWLGPFMGQVLQAWGLQLFDQIVALGGSR